jgi:hypothetical protein
MSDRRHSSWYPRIILPSLYGFFLFLRLALAPNLALDSQVNFMILRVFSLIQWVLILITTGGLGYAFLDRVHHPHEEDSLLSFILSSSLGLGILALMLSLLGFIQILNPISIQAIVLAFLVLLTRHNQAYLQQARRITVNGISTFRSSNFFMKILVIFGFILGCLTLLNTLTPPWDYDGLMYHLLGPMQFLEAGGFYPDLNNWYVNGPFSIEMLFTLGMSIGDDVIPKLLHFTFWLLFSLSSYLWARRWFSTPIGIITLALMLGVPALPIWASFAYIDIAWSLYELLAIACVLAWSRDRASQWLILAGSFTGMAMGSKYLGLFGAGILGLLVLYIFISEKPRSTLPFLLNLSIPVFLFALPWYLKNILWFQNPIYPLVWGGPAWNALRLELYNAYLGSFGTGDRWVDFLSLPWNVYAQNELFGAVMNRNDIPNILFLLAPAALFLQKGRRTLVLSLLCLLRVGVWFLGSQQLRFLLPIYPFLAMLSAITIKTLSDRFARRRSFQQFLPLLSVGLIFIPTFYQIQVMRQYRTLDVLLGRISPDTFLEQAVGDYAATRFIIDELPESARVLMLGNGRGYYCSPKCIPDPDHFYRARQIVELDESTPISDWLAELGMTHLLISIEDLDFLLQHDPTGMMQSALSRVQTVSKDECFTLVYRDQWVEIYRQTCDG